MSSFKVTNPAAATEAADPLVNRVAGEVAGHARSATPRGETGRLAASWRVERDKSGQRRVLNTAPYARFVEYGTRYMSPQPMLGRAVATARSRYGR